MSETKIKETALSINYVDSGNDGFDGTAAMDKIMELLDAPNHGAETVSDGWEIIAPNGKTLTTHREEVVNFATDTLINVSVHQKFTNRYNYDGYRNKEYIREKFFVSKDSVFSSIGSIWSSHIEIATSSNSATKTKVDKVHRDNVLALKDKIVAMKHVLNVEYSCTWRKSNEVECSV